MKFTNDLIMAIEKHKIESGFCPSKILMSNLLFNIIKAENTDMLIFDTDEQLNFMICCGKKIQIEVKP